MDGRLVQPWRDESAGVITFPSGRRIRGRSLRLAVDDELPHFGLYLGSPPATCGWPHVVVPWRDFGLPRETSAFAEAIVDAWERTATQRVEVGCRGGRGRTGTALACLAIVDGVGPANAVRFVRERYDQRAVETPWQARFVRRWSAPTLRTRPH